MNKLLFANDKWDFATIDRIVDACQEIAVGEMGLNVYPNQIEIITTEQMLDAYSTVGLPLFYNHWSFGKRFAYDQNNYKRGMMGLAYEIVINSSPCISYLMEDNSVLMQCLVVAHAAFGHNHFFKNNYLFQQWTEAEGIHDYLSYAKNFIAKCEEQYGYEAVESILDAAHSLQDQGIYKFKKKKLDLREEEKQEQDRKEYAQQIYNDLWRTIPVHNKPASKSQERLEKTAKKLGLPEENILAFLENYAPKLEQWQRDVLRIVRNIAQYFYPQRQTKVMNEGCATWVHYKIMSRLLEKGLINDGHWLEFIQSHTGVTYQPAYNSPMFNGINPYWLGYNMNCDIERIVTNPTEEDKRWMPDIAGCGDVMGTMKYIWANYRDESYIRQFLSPYLMRKLRLFHVHECHSDEDEQVLRVIAIHEEAGYKTIRNKLADEHDVSMQMPNIEIVDVDLTGNRKLIINHFTDGPSLSHTSRNDVLRNITRLWGYGVKFEEWTNKAGSRQLTDHHEIDEGKLV